MSGPAPGRCSGIGVGPGDPELITLKALRVLQTAPVVAYFSAVGRPSNARTVVGDYLKPDQTEVHLVYPVTTEALPAGVSYEQLLVTFYDEAATRLGEILASGRDVAVLCEGDPLFHGSFMYLYNRLADRFPTAVVPGVPAMLAGTSAIGAPLVCRNEVLEVLPGTLPGAELERRLAHADAAVIMKLGRRLGEVCDAVDRAGLLARAWYVERVTMAGERVLPLAEVDPLTAPYFSMVVIPSTTACVR